MTAPCFRKKNSSPPTCGIHDVGLIRRKLPIDRYAPGLGSISCYICPVSGEVVPDDSPQALGPGDGELMGPPPQYGSAP